MSQTNLTRNQEIEKAFKDTFTKYNISSPREQYNIIINVLQGNYDYITRDSGARDVIEKYGKETVRTAILENALLNNVLSQNKNDIKTKITNHIIELQDPNYLQAKGFSKEYAKEVVEKGIQTQLDSITNYSSEGFIDSYLENMQKGLSEEEMQKVIDSSPYIKEAIDSIEQVYFNSLSPEKKKELQTEEGKMLKEAEDILKVADYDKKQEEIRNEQKANFQATMARPIDEKAVGTGKWLIISSSEMDFISKNNWKVNKEEYDKFMVDLRNKVSKMSDEEVLNAISNYSISDVERFRDIRQDGESYESIINYLKQNNLENAETTFNSNFHNVVESLEKHEVAEQADTFLYDEFMKKNELNNGNLTPEQKAMEEKFASELDKMTDDEKIALASQYNLEEIQEKSKPLAKVVELSNGKHWFEASKEKSYDKLTKEVEKTGPQDITNNEVTEMLNEKAKEENIVKMAESVIGSNPNIDNDKVELLSEAEDILKQADEKESNIKLDEISADLDDIQKQIDNYEQKLEQQQSQEIDNSLDNYTMLEQSINQNPNLTDEQKQQARDQLWTDFDKYAEQNPETKGRSK